MQSRRRNESNSEPTSQRATEIEMIDDRGAGREAHCDRSYAQNRHAVRHTFVRSFVDSQLNVTATVSSATAICDECTKPIANIREIFESTTE
jgi:hypothetical protein